MCSSNPGAVVLPFGLKVPNPNPYVQFGGSMSQVALDLHRAQQICDYNARLQYGVRGFPAHVGFGPYHPPTATDPYLHHYLYKDPRVRYVHEEPKPNHSYIGLIAMAILSSREKKLVLSDIYQWILDNYPYFRTRGPGWRNSIRHNLSLNDCFIKSGRSANGKGHYWAIHPANVDDFQKGDFRRRRAQRRVRKHMGLSVPDDDDSPSPSPSCTRTAWEEEENIDVDDKREIQIDDELQTSRSPNSESGSENTSVRPIPLHAVTKKRLFDVESLLAPDEKLSERRCVDPSNYNRQTLQNSSNALENQTNQHPATASCEINIEKIGEKENMTESQDGLDLKSKSESETMTSQRQEPLFLTETATKLWHHGFRHFNVPMMISHPSAFQNARGAGNAWNSLSTYLGSFPLLGIKSNHPALSVMTQHKQVSSEQSAMASLAVVDKDTILHSQDESENEMKDN